VILASEDHQVGVPGPPLLSWFCGVHAGVSQVVQFLKKHLIGAVEPSAYTPLVVARGSQKVKMMSGGRGGGGTSNP
jgi:hypothetical protein